jgi:hypothetical protein
MKKSLFLLLFTSILFVYCFTGFLTIANQQKWVCNEEFLLSANASIYYDDYNQIIQHAGSDIGGGGDPISEISVCWSYYKGGIHQMSYGTGTTNVQHVSQDNQDYGTQNRILVELYTGHYFYNTSPYFMEAMYLYVYDGEYK